MKGKVTHIKGLAHGKHKASSQSIVTIIIATTLTNISEDLIGVNIKNYWADSSVQQELTIRILDQVELGLCCQIVTV